MCVIAHHENQPIYLCTLKNIGRPAYDATCMYVLHTAHTIYYNTYTFWMEDHGEYLLDGDTNSCH